MPATPISRRTLFKQSTLLIGAGAVSNAAVVGLTPSADAASAMATLANCLVPANVATSGYRKVSVAAGEPHLVRTDLGVAAQAGRNQSRKNLLAFVQLSDVHIVDHQSPMRTEWLDRFEDKGASNAPTLGAFDSAHRPQEILTAQVADAMVRAINNQSVGPVTGAKFSFAIQTGDNSDNCQHNEVRWNIDVLDGGKITPDSGNLARYEGVMDSSRSYYDPHYWHPEGNVLGKPTDIPRANYGFPTIKGLTTAARRSFSAAGLNIPWYSAFGNHDGLVQGNLPHTFQLSNIAVGMIKIISPPPGLSQSDLFDLATNPLALAQRMVLSSYAKLVTPDINRRIITKRQVVAEHFKTTGLPIGHGFTAENKANGTAYYSFDQGKFRFVVLDSVNPNGYADGSIDTAQFSWLQKTLNTSVGKAVMIFSHHTSASMNNTLIGTGGNFSKRVTGTEIVSELLNHREVIAWLNGHTHKNQITAHQRSNGGGFWEINTASHIDWPQQSRIIEITNNLDGSLSIFTTMLDHAGSVDYQGDLSSSISLAGLSREISLNDWQLDKALHRGDRNARNVELLVATPPGF